MKPDIYGGTAGTLVDIDKITYNLSKYIIEHGGRLNYEVLEDRSKIVIITGKNEQERELPTWGHPLVFKHNNQQCIAMDFRAYMKSNLTDITTIRECMLDKYNATLQLQRLVFTKLLVDEKDDWVPYVKNGMSEIFGTLISNVTSTTLLDTSIKDSVSIVAKLHVLSLIMDEDSTIDHLLMKLPKTDNNFLYSEEGKQLVARIKSMSKRDEMYFPSTTIGELVNNIQAIISSDRANGLTSDIYVQLLSRSVYSLDGNGIALAMIEDLPTLLSITIMAMTESINSKGSFRKIIDGNKYKIDHKNITEVLLKTFKENLLEV